MKEQWRQQMQEKLADYKRPAPEVLWEELDKALANNRHVGENKAKTVPMWTRRIAAAVVALVAVTGGYLAFHHEETPVDNKVEAVNRKPIQMPVEPKADELQPTNEAPAKMMANNTTPHLLAQNHEQVLEIQDDASSVNAPESTTQEEQTIQEAQESQVEKTQETQKVVESSKRQTLDEPYEIHKSKVSEDRLMAKVYLSNGLSGNNLRANTDYYMYYDTDPGGSYQGLDGSSVEAFNGSSGQGSGQEKTNSPTTDNGPNPPVISTKTGVREESIKHRLPVRFGLSLRYRLNDRWSLESGLAYTRLRSDIKQNDNGVRTNTEQTLSYIGIPITASYLLKSSRYVNFYVSAGGMVEKMVKGRQHHEYVGKNQERTESVSIRPLQFSMNGGFGAEFNLSPLFSIYAEPGVGYYFDNGSIIPTYYQDKPFSFNLNLGLRFNIK